MLLNSDKKFTKNYFSNPRAENGVYSWNLYNDGAATRPVNGTGGSPAGFTLASSSAAPLEGSRSLRFSKDTSDRQGNGYSTDMVVDLGLQGKMCQVRFDYRIVSGTFVGSGVNTVDSDLIVYFYDVTNSALIEPSCIVMDGTSTGLTFTYKGNLQIPTNCASLRFMVHCAKTSNGAGTDYVLDFDNFSLSEQIAVQGAPVSDWTVFPPTGTNVDNSPLYQGAWRRVGDSMECWILMTSGGGNTAGTLGFNLPTGKVIDTTKLFSSSYISIGSCVASTSGSTGIRYNGDVRYASTTQVRFVCTDATVDEVVPFTFASGDTLGCTFMVPIVGWGTSTSISGVDADDGRLVAFKAYRSAALTTLAPNNTNVKIAFETVLKDSHLAFNTTDNRFIAPVSGWYKFNTGVLFASTNVLANTYALRLYKNNARVEILSQNKQAATTAFSITAESSPHFLVAGDYIEVFLYGAGDNSTNNIAISEGVDISYFGGYRLPSTTSISSGETVSCKYTTNAGQSIANNSDATVIFEDKIYDTHGFYNVSTGIATVPISGKYIVESGILYASHAMVATNPFTLAIFKNSSINVEIDNITIQANSTQTVKLKGVAEISMLAGETLLINTKQVHGAALTLDTTSTSNYVCITRVGA